jgi:SseB protein N-terminal domain
MTNLPEVSEDTGEADPSLLAALLSGDEERIVPALLAARVFVPVSARLIESRPTDIGLVAEKESEMTVLLLAGEDGQHALGVFSDVTRLMAWADLAGVGAGPEGARPVAVGGAEACLQAFAEGSAALVIDVHERHAAVLDTEDLAAVVAPGQDLAGLRQGGGAAARSTETPEMRLGSWAPSRKLRRALRSLPDAVVYVIDIHTDDRGWVPGLGLALTSDSPEPALQALSEALDAPIDVVVLDADGARELTDIGISAVS